MSERREIILPGLPAGAFLGSVSTKLLPGAGEYSLVSVLVLGVPIAYTATYIVARTGAALLLVRDDQLGKAADSDADLFPDGTVRHYTIEADAVVGASGTTNGLSCYDVGPFANLAYDGQTGDTAALEAEIRALDVRLDRIASAAQG